MLASLTPAERRRALALAGVVLGLHALGLALLLLVVTPHHYFGLGVGITAYTLGLRHAFDADHIGAIDNTTRKLMGAGQRPLSVGFFFALGHSSVVFGLAVLVVFGVRGLSGALQDDGSTLHQATGVVGPLVSGSFLLLIGLLNLAALAGIWRIFRRLRQGELDEAELEAQLGRRGGLTRLLGRATRAIRQPWHMYPLGVLFGLGFDTATEVGLLVLAGAGAANGLPFYAILCLPVLFTAGMVLFDTLDGAVMSLAYGWAFAEPARKIFYNLTVTALSVAVALGVGALQLASVLWNGSGGIDLNLLGYGIVALFLVTWAAAVAVWRFGHVEERWSK